ncbi:hypothetical protein ACP275_08G208300 [Erythranthe tilingii]
MHRLSNRFKKISNIATIPWVLPHSPPCSYCGEFRFHREGAAFCCSNGQISLVKSVVCPILYSLFTDTSDLAIEFRRRARTYNNAFAFTSMKTDPNSWWAKDGIYALKVVGQVCHFMNSIDGSPNTKDLLQLFFLDTTETIIPQILQSKDLRTDILALLIAVLSDNPYSIFFKRLKSWDNLQDAHIVIRSNSHLDQRTYNLPTVDEVAAVWKDSDGVSGQCERDIRVFTDGGSAHRVKYHYSCHDPLQYPLLFPKGEPGWHARIKKMGTSSSPQKRKESCQGQNSINATNASSAEAIFEMEEEVLQINKNSRMNVSCREFSCYKAQMCDDDQSYLLHSGRLGHQYAIDSYVKLETSRLDYYRCEQLQKDLRTESFQGVIDSLNIDGENDPANIGKKVLDMRKRYVNAMALVQRFGKPDLFLTMTCNPAWKEIQENLLPTEKPHDRPDLIARVFKAKLEELKDEIVRKKIFGDVAAYVYVVESQKRSLPHAHWVIILKEPHKIISADVYDDIISAELPDSDHPFLRSYVVRHMMHGPCGDSNPSNVCMRNVSCKNHYPKQFSEITVHGRSSYPCYKRRDDGNYVVVRKVRLDNRYVVPYNPYLLAKFDCHINVEICSDIKLVKYLYKYIYKGHDKMAYHMVGNSSSTSYDEIQAYQDGRYICAPEAYWRIYAFPLSEIYPAVIILPVHLPNHKPLRFDSGSKKWKLRKKQIVVGRLSTVSPSEGERYFERLLLMHVRCPRSFEELKSVGHDLVGSFREAAVFRRLLESDDYVDNCLAEAVHYQMPSSLRRLFAMLLVYGITPNPQVLWDKYYSAFSEDYSRLGELSESEIMRKTISSIDNFLLSMDKSISDFSLRMSKEYEHEQNMEVSKEDFLSRHQLNVRGIFFVGGPGGTGKTFLYHALLAYVRSKTQIALVVATSGVAASLLPGGRTAHSRFKLPLHADDKNSGNIIKQCNEAYMANRHSIEALDESLQDLMSNDLPFGGKTVLFGGDFKQTLPIVPGGSRESMIAASIVATKIWPVVTKIKLQENMRAKEDPDFVSFLMRIGNGDEPFLFEDNILIPTSMLIPFVDIKTSLSILINKVFPYKFPGALREYVSYNKTIDSKQQGEYEDYLNSVSVSGLPPHILRFKKNCPIMLLRNLNPIEGLCNGTRLICRELGDHFIGAEIAVGDFKGNHVFIPRIPLESSDKQKCPIPFKRMQFPVRPCFVMTINKAQGQTLDFVGVYLREPVFSHGQLYVALSRARSASAVKILIQPGCENSPAQEYTKNIVFKEIYTLAQGH